MECSLNINIDTSMNEKCALLHTKYWALNVFTVQCIVYTVHIICIAETTNCEEPISENSTQYAVYWNGRLNKVPIEMGFILLLLLLFLRIR